MDRTEIQRLAYSRMSKLESAYSDSVPVTANAYWRLNYLIAEGLTSYISSYGLLPINAGDANDGRQDLGMGPLSPFERDSINYLDDYIEKNEKNQFSNIRAITY